MANLATISGNILGDSGIDSIDLIVGTGTVNYIPKFTAEGNIGNSLLVDNGSILSYNGNQVVTLNVGDSRYLMGTTNPGSVNNFTISIGNNGSYSYVQSHSSMPLELNPLGNTVRIAGNIVLHAGNYGSYVLPLSGGTVTGLTVYEGSLRSRKSQTTDYTTAAIWTESFSSTLTGIAFHISGIVGRMLYMGTDANLYWNTWRVLDSSNSPYAWNMNQYVRTTDSPTFFASQYISADNSTGYVASRIWLYSHNNARGAGIYMSGVDSTWFAGTPYNEFSTAYIIARRGIAGDDSTAWWNYGLFRVDSGGHTTATGSFRAPIFYDSADTSYYLDPNADLSLKVYGEISNSNYQQGAMQPGALNIGRTDTNYAWDGSTWSSDIRLGILANTSETWEMAVHDSGDSVMSLLHYDGSTTLTLGRDIGWGRLTINSGAGYVSNGNPWGTANSAYFPNGITTAGGTNWVYGGTYIGNAPTNGSGVEIRTNGSSWFRSSSTGQAHGYAGYFVDRSSAATNYAPWSFENEYGNHSWGVVARFHIQQGSVDRPSIQFSSGSNNTRWGVGYCYSDDNFRISQDIGMAPDGSGGGWGTTRFRIDTSGNSYFGATANFNYISNGSVWINNGTEYNNYNENIRLFNAPNGVSVIAFSASGTGGTPTTSILGYSDRLEFRYTGSALFRIWSSYTWSYHSFYTDGHLYSNYSMRMGEIWGYGGIYRSAGDMMFGVESGGWRFHYQNSQKVYIGTDGNIWMAWAGAYISTLLDAKQNTSTAINTSNIGSQSVNYANSAGTARYLPTNYVGGVYTNPQQYFNYTQGLNVAMTGAWSVWSDTLWINGYSGGDVPWMCALHFLRNSEPRMAISAQTATSGGYGAYYEVVTAYNSPYALNMNQYVRTSDSPTFSQVYLNGWFRNNSANQGLYNQTTTMHFSSKDNGFWDVSSTNTVSSVRLFTEGHVANIRGYLYANTSNEIGFLRYDGNWTMRTDGSSNCFAHGTLYSYNDVVAYYSDERLKTRTGSIENALSKILSLEGFIYKHNELAASFGYIGDENQIGLSAQQVKAIAPELVTLAAFDVATDEAGNKYSKSGQNYLTVKYDRLVPVLIEAIKEQQRQIEELKSRLN